MSTHPNVILLCTLTPDGLARKTHRDILADNGVNPDEEGSKITIGEEEYFHQVMESDYDDEWQVSSKEGDIIVLDFVTYGYGEQIEWDKLAAQKETLESWAKSVCEKHHCSYKISITANYW